MNFQRGLLRLVAIALTSTGVLELAGCVEQLGDMRTAFAPTASAPVKIAVGSLRGANVALASVEGAPAPVVTKFSALFAVAAFQQNLDITDVARANYFVRGYLTAYPVEGGVAVGYVWDVFDSSKHRAQRVSDSITIKSSNTDAWALADEAVLASLAEKSVNDLAVFLADTPEVRSAAITLKPVPGAKSLTPLAYAPVE